MQLSHSALAQHSKHECILNINKILDFGYLTFNLAKCNMREEFKQVTHKKTYNSK